MDTANVPHTDVPVSLASESGQTITFEPIHPTQLPHTQAQGGVNVLRAEADFAELSKQLSRTSNLSHKISRVQSRRSQKDQAVADVEKGSEGSSADSEEPFDLEKVLRGGREDEEAAGIKPKRIGVVWDGLTVSGIGGVKNYVKTFPDAFVSFFNVFETAASILGLSNKGKEFDILKDFKGVARPGEMVLVLGRPGSGCTSFLKVIKRGTEERRSTAKRTRIITRLLPSAKRSTLHWRRKCPANGPLDCLGRTSNHRSLT